MSKPKHELCGSCGKGSQPIRKSINESNVCACGALFFSQIIEEGTAPSSQTCLIDIPMDFIQVHGHRFDKMNNRVILEEEGSDFIYRVKIVGNNYSGFRFEWKDFSLSHKNTCGQTVVFTLLRSSRFLVQIYKQGNPLPIATEPQTPIEIERADPVQTEDASKIKDEDSDDIEVCAAQDWLAARASRSKVSNPAIGLNVTVKQVFLESSTVQATQAPETHGEINAKAQQKNGIKDPKVEVTSEIFKEGCSVQSKTAKESPVLTTPIKEEWEERIQATPPRSSGENVEIDLDLDSSSTSDPPDDPHSQSNSKGRRKASGTSGDSEAEDEDEDGDLPNEMVMHKVERSGKRLLESEISCSIDSTEAKRVRPSDVEKEFKRPSDKDRRIGTDSLIERSHRKEQTSEKPNVHILSLPCLPDLERSAIVGTLGLRGLASKNWYEWDNKLVHAFRRSSNGTRGLKFPVPLSEWTADLFAAVYGLPNYGDGLLKQKGRIYKPMTEAYFRTGYVFEQGWKIEDCVHEELKLVMKFLKPLWDAQRPYRVSSSFFASVILHWKDERRLNWAALFSERLRIRAANVKEGSRTGIAPWLVHICEFNRNQLDDQDRTLSKFTDCPSPS